MKISYLLFDGLPKKLDTLEIHCSLQACFSFAVFAFLSAAAALAYTVEHTEQEHSCSDPDQSNRPYRHWTQSMKAADRLKLQFYRTNRSFMQNG